MSLFNKILPSFLHMPIILALSFLFGWILFRDALSRQTAAQQINIVTSLLPPYMDEAGQGREAEIIRSAFVQAYKDKNQKVVVQFTVQPFSRHWMSFVSDRRYQAVTTVPKGLKIEGYKSNSYINFRNGIGYRARTFSGDFKKFSFEKLAGYRVVAFAGASRIISGLKEQMSKFSLYIEEPDQKIHSKLLLEGQVDAVVTDGAIFFEYNSRLNGAQKMPDATFAAVFCPTPYTLVFRSAEMRDRFNKGLGLISGNGTLAEIEKKYSWAERRKNNFYQPEPCLR